MLIYLCEDSVIDLLMLKHHLHVFSEEHALRFQILSFSDGNELLTAYSQAAEHPVLLFMDIYMNGKNGMDTAKQLRNMGYTGGIIFTTASTEHAMDSYEVNALYYLQKPYDHLHFKHAMERCGTLFQKANQNFTFYSRKKELTVPYSDILFFETGRHTVLLHTTYETISFSASLTQITNSFCHTDSFLPIGKSYLINLHQVSGQSDHDLIMSDGSIVQIPVKKRSTILAYIEQWNRKQVR
ncbi:MAG: LytTR family DNA-binding domain-containing protein [Lachnospiraceae bacterium]|nr:LytTR family DNA-binding domain-containing protein [Lachnospiraceae bacterium]